MTINRNHDMSEDSDKTGPKSKQQQKREAEAVQTLGKAMVELPKAQFDVMTGKLELPEKLYDALVQCRSIKAREARRRQLQYIGKLMRGIDPEPVQQLLDQLKHHGQVAKTQLHQLETWRERLLTEGDEAFQELLSLHPDIDAKQVRRLIAAAQREAAHKQPPRAARQLFRYLRDLMGG